jgi:uncharacterized protein (UPF0335 family)
MKKLAHLSDRQQRLLLIFLAVLFAVSTLIFASTVAVSRVFAQTAINGEWTAELSRKSSGKVQITFSRRSEKGGFNMMGETFAATELQGLNVDAANAARSDVSFSLVREAGTLSCEGTFRDGRGVGFWTFTPNQNFPAAMKSRGYGPLSDDEMLRATFHNLTAKYADDLKAAGHTELEFKSLLRASSHDISLAYLREMQSAGYPALKMDELIRARNHDIDANYLKEVRAMGFDKQPLETVIRLKNHDITPDFISRTKAAGFTNITIEGLVRLKNHDVTPEFVSEIRAEGYTDVSPDTIVRLKNHDVDVEFIRRAKAQGYGNATLEEIIKLKNRGTVK